MNNRFFRKLPPAEVERFKAAARENYTPGEEVSTLWHPVYRAECECMNAEETQKFGAEE